MINIKANNKNIFPEDFFDVFSPKNKPQQITQKDHPKLINPSNTIKKVSSKTNDFKEIKEETVEESVEQQKKNNNNLKIIIPDNSNDDMEPSTSGSKLSQNTPSNSQLTNAEKNKSKNILFDKDDKNTIEDEELLKATPHFINENKVSCESVKENELLRRPKSQNIEENCPSIKAPLTCENKCYNNYKFNFNFEIRDNGAIIPKDKDKDKQDEKKAKRLSNVFRVGNKNTIRTTNKNINNFKQDYSSKKISNKECQNDKLNHSPKNSSLICLKYNINQAAPVKSIKNKEHNKINKNVYNTNYNTNKIINDNGRDSIRNKKNKSMIDNQKILKNQRPKSVKNITPQKRNSGQNSKIKDLNKNKNNNFERKKYCNSVNKNSNLILPYLTENRCINIKNELQTELQILNNLPDNYEEVPEIKNNLNLIFQGFDGLKDYLNKQNQCSCRPKRSFFDNK